MATEDAYYEVPNGKVHRSTDAGVTVACGRGMTGVTPIASDEVARVKRRKTAAERLCGKCFPRKAS